jgi:hypothetical protein
MDYDIARVTWEDSCEPTPNSEVEPNEIPEPLLIEQAGWIVEDSRGNQAQPRHLRLRHQHPKISDQGIQSAAQDNG